MSTPSIEAATPRLARAVRTRRDPLTGSLFLLYPEGVLELSATAAAIIELCNTRKTVGEIASILSLDFEGVPSEIQQDVFRYFLELQKKQLIVLEETIP